MLKRILVIAFTVLLIGICVIFILEMKKDSSEREKNEESEIIKIFEEYAVYEVFLESSVKNTNDIQKQLEEIKYVDTVEFISKENAFENMKNKLGNDKDLNTLKDFFPSSFIVRLKLNSKSDIEFIKDIKDNIAQIEGVDNIQTGVSTLVKRYEEEGLKGLREYSGFLKEQASK